MKRNYFGATLTLFALTFIIFGGSVAANAQAQFRKALDFDGDGKTDITTIRRNSANGTATWFTANSSTNNSLTATQWGNAADYDTATGDYDGDGKADLAVERRNGTVFSWYVRRSQTNTFYTVNFGATATDFALPADYDGDGKTDIAVARRNSSGTGQLVSFSWYYLGTLTGQIGGATVPIAVAGQSCLPTNGDYDGDGKADFVHRCGYGMTTAFTWDIVFNSTRTRRQIQWGLVANDFVAAGDYDGDGKTDVGVVRKTPISGTSDFTYVWYVLLSSNQSLLTYSFGGLNNATVDYPVPADYDGDGKTDIAVARYPFDLSNGTPVVYYILQSSNGSVRTFQWGLSGDTTTLYGGYNAALLNANP